MMQEMQKEEPELPTFPGRVETVPQRVWILVGGDSSQRQASLASGLNAFMALRHQAEIKVSIFTPYQGPKIRLSAPLT